jgi:hypothetical protein
MGAISSLGRLKFLLSPPECDLLWIEKQLLPWLHSTCERALLPGGVPYVVD